MAVDDAGLDPVVARGFATFDDVRRDRGSTVRPRLRPVECHGFGIDVAGSQVGWHSGDVWNHREFTMGQSALLALSACKSGEFQFIYYIIHLFDRESHLSIPPFFWSSNKCIKNSD